MEGGGVVGDNEGRALNEGHEFGESGVADEVEGVRGAPGELGAGGDLRTLGGGADESDRVAMRDEVRGEAGETVGGPLLGGPAAGGGEHDPSPRVVCLHHLKRRGEFGVECVECAGGRVETHVRRCGRRDAGGAEEAEHAVDGVEVGGEGVALVVGEPGEFASIGEADAAGRGGGAGDAGRCVRHERARRVVHGGCGRSGGVDDLDITSFLGVSRKATRERM